MSHIVYVPQIVTGVTPELLQHVNAERVAYGIQPLVLHPGLTTSAQQWAEHLRDTNTFEHGAWAERIIANYPNWRTMGENLAAGYTTAQDAVDGWMASDGHRANILNSMFEEAGVGYAAGGYYRHYWVMDYGARFT